MHRIFVVMFMVISFIAVATNTAFAAFSNAGMAISTTVLDPQKNTYAHTLGLTDSMYHPGDTVTFHVTITNTGNATIPQATITDTIPSTVSLTSGSTTIVAQNITPHTTQTFAISAKVADANALPTNQGIVCTANKVSAKATGLQTVQDTSAFCIQKTESTTPKPVYNPSQTQTTPATGPEAIPLFSLFGTGIAGMIVRKIAKK